MGVRVRHVPRVSAHRRDDRRGRVCDPPSSRSMPPSAGVSMRCGLAEIHVAPERSVCSAPLTLASAIAARTKRMKIGTRGSGLAAVPPAAARPKRPRRSIRSAMAGSSSGSGGADFPRNLRGPMACPMARAGERFAETLEILKAVRGPWTAFLTKASITASTTSS